MQKLLNAAVFCIALLNYQPLFSNNNSLPNRGCGTMEYTEMEERLNPSIKETRAQIEEEIQAYIKNHKNVPTTQAVITIPIVFHIVYKTAAENVSDACIIATLKSFNDDFRKRNADFNTKCPPAFQSLGADTEIEFCFATKDPSGNPTTGITRTPTTISAFSTDNKVKYTAQGGENIWDRNKYVNMWVCNLSGGVLGYGQLPGGTAATDGVVCHYKYLHKNGGCGATPYELGRTTIHELGHFFNLEHTWGDVDCGNDLVSDTPTQQTANYGCPTFPHVTCSNGPNGDMFMNYMDYTNDACMVMLTAGQKIRMIAALNTSSRSGLKASAATLCTPPIPIDVNDLRLNELVSIYPNPSTGDIFMNITISNISAAHVIIYNAIGEAVLEKRIIIPAGNEVKLDMNNKPEGIYLAKIKTSESTITKKIIINK